MTCQNDNLLVRAYHEAGHAITACYLNVRFDHVTLNEIRDEARGYLLGGGVFINEDQLPTAQIARLDMHQPENALKGARAVVDEFTILIAPRVIAETFGVPDEEVHYNLDDDHLRERVYNKYLLSSGLPFEAFRQEGMREARRIIAIPYVRLALDDVVSALSWACIRNTFPVMWEPIDSLFQKRKDEAKEKGEAEAPPIPA